jgi:site-specific DNA recombinase
MRSAQDPTPEEVTMSSERQEATVALPSAADESRSGAAVEISARRRKSRNRKRLIDSGASPAEMGPGTPVAIYTRVSTEEQAEGGFSLAAQERVCREVAEKRGWTVAEVYRDAGYSGKDDRRPGFRAMFARVEAGQVKVVLTHKLDRFSRNLDHTLRYFYLLNEHDATFVSATEEFDFATAQGRLFFRMLASFAQWYLENLSAETIKGKRERALHGLHNGRLPFGYEVGPEGVAVPVAAEAAIVREAFEKYATGNYTDRQIAQMLNDAGFVTRKGRRWSKDTVRDFLQNEFYMGKVAYRDELHPGRHEAIISPELFARCQQVRRQHGQRPRSHMTAPPRTYLLHRVICCAACGEPLRMQTSHGYYYYKEASRERGLECVAGGKSVRMEQADEQVLALLASLRLPAEWRAEIAALEADADEQRRQAERRQQLLEQKRRVGQAYVDGTLSEAEYAGRLRQLEAELERLVVVAGPDLLHEGEQLERIGQVLAEATLEERAELCRLILEKVYVDLTEGKVVRVRPQPEFTVLFRLAAAEMGWQVAEDGSILV